MNITPLKYILFMENLICLFRNYTSFKSWGRKLIKIGIFLELFNLMLSIVTFAHYRDFYPSTHYCIYIFTVTGFSIGITLSTIYHAKRFHRLLSNFNTYYTVFQDPLYSDNLKRLQTTWSAVGAAFLFIKLLVFLPMYINSLVSHEKHLFIRILNRINISVSDSRLVFEYFLLCCILHVISEQLDIISRSIDSVMNNMNVDIPSVAERVTLVYREQGKCFDKWMQAYRNIKHSSDVCNAIFRVQLSVMLLIVTSYHIILSYSMTKTSLEGLLTPETIASITFSMLVYLSAMFLISKAGQKVHNNSVALRRKLCQLYLHSLENENFSRSTKDFMQFIATRPIRMSLLGSQEVNMALVPSCVGFFTSYTVIALQMNNVL